jgi:predicted CopG family antitoxin
MSTDPIRVSVPTTISVSEDLADYLFEQKRRGESYEDVIWRLIEDDEPQEAASADPDDDIETAPEPAETLADHVDDVVASGILPGSGAKLEARERAFRAVVQYLLDEGEATPAKFRDDVYPEHDGFYTQGKDPARSWWKNAMYPALAELAERTDDVKKADQSGKWMAVGQS